jgi:hypothetical protein
MKRFFAVLGASLFLTSVGLAAGPKDYQVTGPILDVTDDVIVVEKGKEKWEIGRTKDTKVSGDLKKGSRATIHYKMNATSVDIKDGKAKSDKTKDKTRADDKPKSEAKKAETKTKEPVSP